MLLDAAELVTFYNTPLGKVARRLVGAQLRSAWPHVEGLTVVGHGYAVPYLAHFRTAYNLVAVMPAEQGAVRWPRNRPSQVVLAENDRLPLADASVDRLIAVHSLESANDPRRQLREFWRVLKGAGRLIVVVPNRRGLWARRDATPFGSGRPYSRGQLERLLSDAMFNQTGWKGALYAPPIELGLIVKSAVSYERLGATLWPGFSGVVMVEAVKELMAPISGGKTVKATAQLETAGASTWPRKGSASERRGAIRSSP